MRRFLLLSGFILMGALPCKSQDVIVLRGEQSLTGRVLWEKSKGDSLFYNSAVSVGDSLLLFVPRRRVEYVISVDNDERMLYKGKSKGWQPWQGRAFNEVPQQQMLYGASWSLGGWSVDASAMRILNRNNRIGVGAFVRYLSTQPTRDSYWDVNPTVDTYDHQAIAFGQQAEIRGYSRRLKTFFYIATYHRFDWGDQRENLIKIETQRYHSDPTWLYKQYPLTLWTYLFNYRLGAYVRLTRGLYADVAFTGLGYIFDRIPQGYISSDQFPFGLSVGLRFGRERK